MIRTIVIATLLAGPALASEEIADKYPQSVLYDKPFEVIPNVWSAIGATAPPTYENAGHNNNLSFLVTGDGVIVINGGANYKLAEALHAEIREVTDQPVKLVINENGQGHAMLGNNYWTEQGIDVLAHVEAAEEFADYNAQIIAGMQTYAKENAEGTELVEPTITFEDEYVIDMGDMHIEVLHLGPAHSPGDTQVWLPDLGLMIAGDMAFNGRMPPIFSDTCTSCWIETWETAFAPLAPTYIIPGHGYPTNLAQVEHHTMDYVKDLRAKIGEHLDNGGALDDAYYVDQSNWAFLDTYEELATKNAGVVYTEMEFE
ncbi:glyoxylase-like metal-dependent hydrolase (beta-lactamase superfamily II) [Rhodovulum iodosum]|uniref:Glyoxylase-like metal-dependent hydrolase (Beta-lactamase superfamily II) n=1 Tax=Rhodovulum iodosum TaxID=68291 RepID=A0ABV3XVU0_9RHOB|nr:MBL fold metallo-hydrolase [Rhodovulum robiginosum]RSK36364.1 MBL fold metallo-hydrolase [Rhodovulum robiginosum]